MGGIRPLKFVTLDEATTAAIVLVTDERSAGSTSNPWDDLVDIPHGRIVYWGDAKFDTNRLVDDFPGNRALRDAFNQVLDGQVALVPPILHFSKRETGKLRFNGLCVLDRAGADVVRGPRATSQELSRSSDDPRRGVRRRPVAPFTDDGDIAHGTGDSRSEFLEGVSGRSHPPAARMGSTHSVDRRSAPSRRGLPTPDSCLNLSNGRLLALRPLS